MNIQPQIFNDLKEHFGNHTEVAKRLEMSARLYRNIRNLDDGSNRAKQAILLLHKTVFTHGEG